MGSVFDMSEQPGSPSPQSPRSRPETSPVQPQPWLRPLKQFGLMFAGAGFLAASIAVSRRSVLRRRRDTFPPFYVSNRSAPKFDSSDRSLMAVQALSLATLNVMSFGIMLVGAIGWTFDLSSVAELRERTQAITRRKGFANVSPEDEAEMEKIMSDLLGRLGLEKSIRPEAPNSEQEPTKDEK